MPNATTIAAPPKRRWYQYSLRTLLVVVTAICVSLGVIVQLIVVPAERQRAAVRMIEGLGGSVEYADLPGVESWSLQTLRTILPRDYLDAVWGVSIEHNAKLSNADLACLEELTQMKRLLLNGSPVSDGGLIYLKGLTHLQKLDLRDTQVTDAGLQQVEGLAQLQWLRLAGTQVTDAGLTHLRGLTQLTALELANTRITELGLANLQDLTQLQALDLENIQVTDAGLTPLKVLTQLHWIGLDNSQVTEGGIAEFKKALPHCRIQR